MSQIAVRFDYKMNISTPEMRVNGIIKIFSNEVSVQDSTLIMRRRSTPPSLAFHLAHPS